MFEQSMGMGMCDVRSGLHQHKVNRRRRSTLIGKKVKLLVNIDWVLLSTTNFLMQDSASMSMTFIAAL